MLKGFTSSSAYSSCLIGGDTILCIAYVCWVGARYCGHMGMSIAVPQ